MTWPSSAEARWYDAQSGRWLTRDPAGYVDGMNQYQYVSSQPNGALDPYGLVSIRILFMGLGGSRTIGNYQIQIIGLLLNSSVFEWSQRGSATKHVARLIDQDGDHMLSSSEIQSADIKIGGYSQGAFSAIRLNNRLAGLKAGDRIGGGVGPNDGPGEKWHVCDQIPIDTLVTIDPAGITMRPPVPKGSAASFNFYQRRAGRIVYQEVTGGSVGPPIYSGRNPIKGNSVTGARNDRVDLRTGSVTQRLLGLSQFESPMDRWLVYARDVQHDTIVWYVREEVIDLLR